MDPKAAFEWVALAVADGGDDRAATQGVRITETVIEATDGKRLHVAPNPDPAVYLPGFYTEGGAATDDPLGGYLPTHKVIPPHDPEATAPLVVDGLRCQRLPDGYEVYPLTGPGGHTVWVQLGYLRDAAWGAKDPTVQVGTDPYQPIRVDAEDGRLAVIMPVKPDAEGLENREDKAAEAGAVTVEEG